MLPARPLPVFVATQAHGYSVSCRLHCPTNRIYISVTGLSQAAEASGAATSPLSAGRQESTLLPKPERPSERPKGPKTAQVVHIQRFEPALQSSEVHQQQCPGIELQPAPAQQQRTSRRHHPSLQSIQGRQVHHHQKQQNQHKHLKRHSRQRRILKEHQKMQETFVQDMHQQRLHAVTQQPASQQSASQQPQPHPAALTGMSSHVSSVAAAAEAAIERTRQLLSQAKLSDSSPQSSKLTDSSVTIQTASSDAVSLQSGGVELKRPTLPSPSPSSTSNSQSSSKQGIKGTCSGSKSTSTSSPSEDSTRVLHEMPLIAYREYKAAGVVVYDYDEHSAGEPNIRVLLVREFMNFWSIPAGKAEYAKDIKDGVKQPASTAARELEEETHGLIPAAVTQSVLPQCPKMYWKDGKMVLYFLRLKEGQLLPDMAAARIAAGKGRAEAAKVEALAWIPLESILAGRGSKSVERSLRDNYKAQKATQTPAGKAAAASEAAAGSPGPASGPAATTDPAANPHALQPPEHTDQQPQQLPQNNSQQPVQTVAAQVQQQTGLNDQGGLLLRLTLTTNKKDIASWLRLLVSEEMSAAGLRMQPLQQQKDNTLDLLQDPVTTVWQHQPLAIAIEPDAGSSSSKEERSGPSVAISQAEVTAGTADVAAAADALLDCGSIDQATGDFSVDQVINEVQVSSISDQ